MDYIGLNRKTHIFLVGAIAFLLPTSPMLLPLLIGLLILNWLIAPKQIAASIHNLKSLPLALSILFYMAYAAGMLYTTNIHDGLSVLETKFSFLILPFVFVAYIPANKENLFRYMKLFAFGCFINALICFSIAAYRYSKPDLVVLYGVAYDLGAGYFYYNELANFFHPSYIAMYCVLALFGMAYMAKNNGLMNQKNYSKWGWSFIAIVLVLFILLLSSKAGWICFFGFLIYILALLFRHKQYIKAVALITILGTSFYIFNIYFTPRFSARIPKLAAIKEVLANDSTHATTSRDSNGSRILVWKAAVDLVKENPLIGAGTGDAKDKMLEMYQKKGMLSEYENQLNSHNQYLNTAVALGFVGFVILLLCFVVSFYFALKEKNFLLLVFVCLTGINFLFESMLERQAGVIFFVFFYTLFNLQKPSITKSN